MISLGGRGISYLTSLYKANMLVIIPATSTLRPPTVISGMSSLHLDSKMLEKVSQISDLRRSRMDTYREEGLIRLRALVA